MSNKTVLETGLFKIGDVVTIKDTAEVNENFQGQSGKIVKFEVEEVKENPDPKCCIWVNLDEVKDFLFRSYNDYNVPRAEKKWVPFRADELRLVQKPKTPKELVDKLIENSQAHGASIFNEPADHTCVVEGCDNFASGYGIYNSHGHGHVFKACKWHLEQYGNKWCDPDPFKIKNEGVTIPSWLKVEKVVS